VIKKITVGFYIIGHNQIYQKNRQADQWEIKNINRVADPVGTEFYIIVQDQLLPLALSEDAPGQ
jgi:hypothetical protein